VIALPGGELSSTESSTIVQSLWNYCNILRDDGVRRAQPKREHARGPGCNQPAHERPIDLTAQERGARKNRLRWRWAERSKMSTCTTNKFLQPIE
jgi:hypothetical protein